ncbi:hypothetical protein [Borreliella japonica]|uniref:hypothetical protein n=1 Tax=Borreliella japonica TaxID=34095 RepID=UPI002649D930|nr:hypothetical protein [Borreliella japonica]WKC87853.1 hypothetical protein QIA21_01395 [Borreliella japonica]
MAKISKNAQRGGSKELISRWGGKILMKSKFENGKIKHYAECQTSKNIARKPRDLF